MGRVRFLIWLLFLSAGWLAAWPQGDFTDSIAQYEYYPDGLTKTLTYANGVVSRYEYYDNAWLRSLECRTATGELVSRYEYDYDPNGNRTEMREWNATPARRATDPMWAAVPSITRYGYDRLDRLVWVEYHPADAGAPYRRVEYTYDLVGNRLREVAREHAPDGTVLRLVKDRCFRYSRFHRLEAVTDALAPERGTRYLYDAAGNTVARITGVIGPDGGIVPGTEQSRLVFDWDAAARLRRVRQLTLTPDGGTTEELLAEFRYDYRGRRIAADSRFMALGGDPMPTETRLYVYDEEAVLAEYGFSPDGRTPYKSRQYLYGNELLAVELYAPPEAGKAPGDGRPATGFEPSSASQPSTAAGTLAPSGSVFPTRVPSTRPRGQLLPGSSDARMITEEDQFYNRSSHPAETASTFPPPSSSLSLPSSRFPSPVSRSAFGVQRSTFDVRSASPVTGLLFYHLDALGSTVNLTAADGAVAEAYLYDAWGNYRELDVPAGTPGLTASTPGPLAGSPGLPAPGQMAFRTGSGSGEPGLRAAADTLVIDPDLDENGLYCWATYLAYIQGAFSPSPESPASSPADSNRLTYTGHEFDPATGLYYFKARFYDPEIGRFLSEDPYLGDAATPPSLHRFLYAYSNPLRYVDLTGYQNLSAEEILQRKLQASRTFERLADLKNPSAAGDAAKRLPAAAGRAIFSSEVYKTAVEELLAELETGAQNPGSFIDGLVTGTILLPEQIGDRIKEQLPTYRETLIRWDNLQDDERNEFVQGLANRGWINVTKAGIIVTVTHQARIVVESSGRVVRERLNAEVPKGVLGEKRESHLAEQATSSGQAGRTVQNQARSTAEAGMHNSGEWARKLGGLTTADSENFGVNLRGSKSMNGRWNRLIVGSQKGFSRIWYS
ncbi:MAG: RHS repeat-associated core domain-containing protein [Acidobacteria bacterium]|nr:RHS repeat-associated core domain-containing protein [Acidobacteriota bacterium]